MISNELKPKRRYFLSKKELKSLERTLSNSWMGAWLGSLRSRSVECAVYESFSIYIIDGAPCLVRVEDIIFPTLKCLLRSDVKNYPHLIVDRGASLALARGADLMAPGIREVPSRFVKGEVVVAVDEEIRKPVAVLQALRDSKEIEELVRSKGKGKVAKNLHRPNDKIWKAS